MKFLCMYFVLPATRILKSFLKSQLMRKLQNSWIICDLKLDCGVLVYLKTVAGSFFSLKLFLDFLCIAFDCLFIPFLFKSFIWWCKGKLMCVCIRMSFTFCESVIFQASITTLKNKFHVVIWFHGLFSLDFSYSLRIYRGIWESYSGSFFFS